MKANHSYNHVSSYRQFTTINQKLNIQRLTLCSTYIIISLWFVQSIAMYVLLCIHVSCTPHILFTLQIPTRARSVNPFSLQDEVRMILEPRSCPQSQDPRSIYLPLQLAQVKFHSGKWKCSRESWVVTRHQIYIYMDFCRKNPRSAELKYTFCEVEFRQKKNQQKS